MKSNFKKIKTILKKDKDSTMVDNFLNKHTVIFGLLGAEARQSFRPIVCVACFILCTVV